MSAKNHLKGFTLVELMIVTAVMGILISIALPNFSMWIASERVRGQANDLYAGLMMARSEAMKRNAQVDVTRTAGSTTTWSGWSVVLNSSSTTVFQTQDADDRVSITGPSGGTVSYSFTGRPATGSADAEFAVASASYPASDVPTRYVCLTLSGMPNVKRCACASSC